MNEERIRVLLVEDDPGDTCLLQQLLSEAKRVKFDCVHAESLDAAVRKLGSEAFDLVLLDLGLPDTTGLTGLSKIREFTEKVPIVILTGLEDEDTAVSALKLGAQDYLPKRGLDGSLLVRSIRYALERHALLVQLQDALANIRVLKGLLPICSKCKKIRNDKGYWQQVEVYIRERSDAEFTHGLCPECLENYYPEEKAAEDDSC